MSNRLPFARLALSTAVSTSVLVFAPLAFSTLETSASAQSTPTTAAPQSNQTFEATVTASDTLVRSAPNAESGYPFGLISRGATVTVIDRQAGWVRVRTEGASFDGWTGYVQGTPAVTLSADGKTIKISGRAQVNAPNGDADFNPERSWKPIGFLAAGDELSVLQVIKGERDTFYSVPLSGKTSGWIADSAITAKDAPKQNSTSANSAKPAATNTANNTGNAGTTETIEGTQPTNANPAQPGTPVVDLKTGETAPANDATKTTSTKKVLTTKTTTTKTVEVKPNPSQQVVRAKLEELEKKWQATNRDACSIGDLQELHAGFVGIAEDADATKVTRQSARLRSIQLTQVIELRSIKEKTKEVASREQVHKQEATDLELWLRARQANDAVGILNASLVYDGERLPRLYRLQDPVSGYTVAYLREDPSHQLSSMLGLLVGVNGGRQFDESLRRDIITPISIAVFDAKNQTKVVTPEATKPASTEDSNK